MDQVLQALGHELRLEVVRQLRRTPGLRHGEMLSALGLPRSKAGALSKAFDPLEGAGILERSNGKYFIAEEGALTRLLMAAAELEVGAKRVLADKAKRGVPEAERVAEEIRKETESAP